MLALRSAITALVALSLTVFVGPDAVADPQPAPLTGTVSVGVPPCSGSSCQARGTCRAVRTLSSSNSSAHSTTATYTLVGEASSISNATLTVQCRLNDTAWTSSLYGGPRGAYTAGLRAATLTHTNPFKLCVYVHAVFSNFPLGPPTTESNSNCVTG